MATFEQFRNTFPEDSNDKGRDFEVFLCEWFLKEHPVYRNQFKKIWHFTDWPERWHGSDIGTDLIAEDIHGKICAIQAKFYHSSHSIPTTEIDSFLSDSNRKIVDYRLLIGTTDYYSANAANKIEGQEKPVQTFLLNEFLSWNIEWPDSLASLNDFSPPKPKTPREHQHLAINDVVENLDSRGQLIMACGTGKTMTGLWIVEELDASTTLVLLPSLLLLSQTMFEWKSNSKQPFYCLPVCSDEKVTVKKGNSGGDNINLSTSELCLKPTTDADEIASFMKLEGRKVIFSTYQSSSEIEKAFRSSDIKPFDLVIADEAHRCSGKTDSDYSKVLDDNSIPAYKRLFMTATPRIYQSSFKKKASESGVEVVSMDDESVFGPVLHKLSFGEAIERDLLTDYQVVIVGIDNPSYSSMIERRTLVETETKIESDAQSFASHIGLAKAVKNYDLSRIISFHSRVSSAKDFASKLPEVIDWMSDESKPDGELITNYVSGVMPTSERNKNLRALADINKNQKYILSNARCLSEGVDIPALDGVAFVDPRNSEIDIVQAVGRAIRLSKNKSKGSIVIPVFIEDHEDPDEILNSSPFKKVWAVVNALRAHDDLLGQELDQLRYEVGKRGTVGKSSKIIFDLPTTITQKFETALATRLIEATTASWEFWFGLLNNFLHENENLLVPLRYQTSDGFWLGQWVSDQRERYGQNLLSLPRIKKLNGLGFVWDVLDFSWEKSFKELCDYKKQHGHCLVKIFHVTTSGFRLGQWTSTLRQRKDKLKKEQIKRLDEIDFVWDKFQNKWEKRFEELVIYKDTYGHCAVPKAYKTNTGINLGSWVQQQRQLKAKMPKHRFDSLDQLGFTWDKMRENWEEGFDELIKYKNKFGHLSIPSKYKTSSGYKLGSWVTNQMNFRSKMGKERISLLDELGFKWSRKD